MNRRMSCYCRASIVVVLFFLLCQPDSVVAAQPSKYQIQPLFTRQARTVDKITFNSMYKYFTDVELQEVDEFDGYELNVDLTVPFLDRFQARVFYPIYTDGDARLTDPHNPASPMDIDIDGNGGTFDFPSLVLEYEARRADTPEDWMLAVFGGAGFSINDLDTTAPDPDIPGNTDVYNHQGKVALFGLKADKAINEYISMNINLGWRYYWESDDLNVTDLDDDTFFFMDASVAAIYHSQVEWLHPALELVYQGEFSDYNSLLAVPQVIVPFCKNFELKAGATLGLTGDGEQVGARVQGTLRF